MRFFFKSRKFKIIVAVTAIVVSLAVLARIAGGIIAPQASVFGAVAAPFQKMFTDISNYFEDLGHKFSDNEALILENAELQDQINSLNEKIADYEQIQAENEFYKNYLEIKEANPDFKFADATIISRDMTDEYQSFTIDVGTLDGIEAYDPVITDAGLVGYISEAGVTTSKVRTLLNPAISVGALDSRTGDAGVISGTLEMAGSGRTKMINIQRSSSVAVGDYVVTSGSGVFPSGLLIGKIKNVSQEKHNTALYAELEPFVNIAEIRKVMVITDFSGKSSIELPNGEE